jgi:hypothetical protein
LAVRENGSKEARVSDKILGRKAVSQYGSNSIKFYGSKSVRQWGSKGL